eukprot:CAMPEP_0197309924 /NCGR_PEP_ID=MMETSP0891-20130614/8538_1 /TAXON_ID=44058 ORGANISM="Aureoumbra lagunensis, Strain CCMP1510" /NCGR_SAMPLE_ID=MMETSP0891 /ASSEMBLY_ACC=CAM_ASM_000534 /LENGTH=262 /DNA_ID=CAMNT_0042795297 /DNA_START=850 /DNA_END=1635 /DNA_ORIENTATION=-
MELVFSSQMKDDDDEEALIENTIRALRKSTCLQKIWTNEHNLDYVAGAFVSSTIKIENKAIEKWILHAFDTLSEVLEEVNETMAEAMIEILRFEGVLEWQFAQGTQVLAILDEDNDWHEAIVSSPLDLSTKSQRVLFTQWQKPQMGIRDSLCLLTADDDDTSSCQDGLCLLCQRSMPLTFHHLVPKEEHERWIGKVPPLPWKQQLSAEKQEMLLSRSELGSYGIMICRPCHSTVHRFASNSILAQKYCTLESLATHPDIIAW